MAKQEIA
jgi:RTX calcium-binding nonapeptide repeat (4 copies)